MSDARRGIRYALAPTTVVLHAGLAVLAIGGAVDSVLLALAGAAAVAAGIGARSLRTDANVRRAFDQLQAQRERIDADRATVDAGLTEIKAAIAQRGEASDQIRADLDALHALRERSGRALEIRISRSERLLTDITSDVDEVTRRIDGIDAGVAARCATIEGDVHARLSSLEHLGADVEHLLGTRSWSSTRRRTGEKPETHLSAMLTTIPGPDDATDVSIDPE